MIRYASLSGLCAICFLSTVGCGNADQLETSDDTQSYESTESDLPVANGDIGADGDSEIGTAEQAITMPVETGGGATQCVAACTRIDTTNLTGMCCVCNGAVKTFSRSTFNANVYLCK